MSNADAVAAGKQFSVKMVSVLKEYTDKNIVIFDSSAIISTPDGHDITQEVADKIGIKLEK